MGSITFTLENRSEKEDLVYRVYHEYKGTIGVSTSGFVVANTSKEISASGPDNYFVQGFLVGKNFTDKVPLKNRDKIVFVPSSNKDDSE